MKARVLNIFSLELAGVFFASFVLISALLYTSGTACGEQGAGAGCGSSTVTKPPNPAFTAVPLSAVYQNTFAIKSDGTLWGWGLNDYGQIGIGISTHQNNVNIPTQIGTDHDWAIVSTGWYHVMAIKTNGTLWGWGSNDFGQLGLGTSGYQSGNKNTPKQIGTDKDWIAVAAGRTHTVALKRDHSLWTWGSNEAGQLGNDNLNNITKPTRMGTDNDWIAITAGQYYTIALKQDGTIWSWGSNAYCDLGYQTNNNFPNPTPKKIGNDKDWAQIWAGGYNAAIKNDGSLWVWGYVVSQLTGDKAKMMQVPGLDWQTVSVGNNQGFAFNSVGGWFGWGQDILFDSDTTTKSNTTPTTTKNFVRPDQPFQISVGDWEVLIAGYEYSYGVKSDGSLWAWGANSVGELGSGNFNDIDVPTKVWKIK